MLILASASPRRQELLHLITHDFIVKTSDVDESVIYASTAKELVEKLAQAKAQAVAQQNPADTVIGCDTVVDLDGVPLGKPKDKNQAREMMRALSGRVHLVHTGVCLVQADKTVTFSQTSEVEFSPLSEEEIESYISTDEPYDKAGGYGIQGGAAKFICAIKGCYFNIMGLPVSALYRRMKDFGCETMRKS